jgi:nicotinate-nucleotide pyrophosphorylase (carboxylating)
MDLDPIQPSDFEIDRFLEEDVGDGDLTAAILPYESTANAVVLARESFVLCGTSWFDRVFYRLDPKTRIHWHYQDGESIEANATICSIQGRARSLMTGERTALNLLQTLSATATISKHYADAVRGTSTVILDTRKTIPGLRAAQKYAVLCGGCQNHRIGLFDAILIKENHIAAMGSITLAVQAAVALGKGAWIEVEVETLDELEEALAAGAGRILLDEFTPEMVRTAVDLAKGQAQLEVSGNVTLESVRAIAALGVDFISVGALTKHIRAVDLSMRVTLD